MDSFPFRMYFIIIRKRGRDVGCFRFSKFWKRLLFLRDQRRGGIKKVDYLKRETLLIFGDDYEIWSIQIVKLV
jgi:hypothetical protein